MVALHLTIHPRAARRCVALPGLLLLWTALTPPASMAQTAPLVDVGVRPQRVRVGDTFILTARVRGAGLPNAVDLVGAEDAVEMVDFADRTSTALGRGGTEVVLERDFTLRALTPGSVADLRVQVVIGADTTWSAVPTVDAVGSPLAWHQPGAGAAPRSRARERDPIRDEGRPPSGQGRDADRERAPEGTVTPGYPYPGYPAYPGAPMYPGYPGGGYSTPYDPNGGYATPFPNGGYLIPGYPYPGTSTPYPYPNPGGIRTQPPETDSTGAPVRPGYPYPGGGAYPRNPYLPDGWGVAPVGQDWAATAAGDPWWPELVPILERYQTSAEDPTGLVRLEAGLTPSPVYEGQQVTLVATATFAPEAAARLGTSPELFPPSAGDAWSVDVPYAPPTPAAARGRVEEAHTFMRAYFPVSPGTLQVEPVRLSLGGRPGIPGGSDVAQVATEPLSVEVRPIPRRDVPAGWSGAVGRYRVRAWVQPSSVGWGESALLTVEVSGAGNVRALRRPEPGQVWGAELRPTGERAVVEVRDGVVGGVKTFSWLVVPVEAGQLRIGPVLFPYFDPWIGAYGQVASEEVYLESRGFPGDARGSSGRGAATAAPARGGGGPAGASSDTLTAADPAVPASDAAGEGSSRKPASVVRVTEAQTARLREHLAQDPGDAEGWLSLSDAYERLRPGEGWGQWALVSGLRHRPRDAHLRRALWQSTAWAPASTPGLPRLPLSPSESRNLSAGLLGLAALLAVAAFRGRRLMRARLGVATTVALVSLVALEPWVTARNRDDAVTVGGVAELRAGPLEASGGVGQVAGGTSVAVKESYGAWVRVGTRDGRSGWMERVRLSPLG